MGIPIAFPINAELNLVKRMRLTTLAAIREALSTIITNNHTVHLSNLSWVTSKKQLFDYFSQFGKIKNITLPLDQRFGVHRGYAFIDFDDEQSVRKVFTAGQIQQIDETNVRLSRSNRRATSSDKLSISRVGDKSSIPQQRINSVTEKEKNNINEISSKPRE